MEINYTFYFFAFLRKMIKKLLTFCYWHDKLVFMTDKIARRQAITLKEKATLDQCH